MVGSELLVDHRLVALAIHVFVTMSILSASLQDLHKLSRRAQSAEQLIRKFGNTLGIPVSCVECMVQLTLALDIARMHRLPACSSGLVNGQSTSAPKLPSRWHRHRARHTLPQHCHFIAGCGNWGAFLATSLQHCRRRWQRQSPRHLRSKPVGMMSGRWKRTVSPATTGHRVGAHARADI